MPPAVELRRLTRSYPSGGRTLTVLDRVDLAIPRGEFAAVLGRSGSGKSTLLALIAGLDRPSAGEVWLDGERIDRFDEDRLALCRRGKVGFVFQSYQLLESFTARENVLVPLELLGRTDAAARADELLAGVGLADRGHHYPAQLSGGEQQRVAIARAFAGAPGLILADEPTGNLDSETGEGVLDLIDRLRRASATTVVLVTHDAAIAARAERLIGLKDGRIERDERPGAAGAA